MKLQFAFGNPRKGKKRKKGKKKGVARQRKSRKTKSVKSKLRKALSMAKSKRRSRRRKNPEASVIRKGGKVIGREFSPLNKREEDAAAGKYKSLLAKYKAANLGAEKNAIYKEMAKLRSKLGKRVSYLKTLARYAEDPDKKISSFNLAQKGEGSVAKRRKKKKKKSVSKKAKTTRRRRRKSRKAAAAPKVSRRKKSRRKGGKRKSSRKGKRRMSKAAKRAFVARMKKARGVTAKPKKRRSKKRRRSRMITHRHAASTRHLKKGTSFRFKTVAKKGKRKITVSGRVKVNPRRRNPMANLSAQSKKYLGLDAAELTAVAVGGLAVPLVNAGISKIPGAGTLVAKINEIVGPQATGSVVPILAGVAMNVGGDYASGDVKRYLKLVGEGLAIAGVVSLIAGLSQRYVAPALGLSGINYTPRGMRGINYTPTMRGINFTPGMGIQPQLNGRMGIMPQLNGMGNGADFGRSADFGEGYTEAHKRSRADFGANFSEDSEAEGLEDQDNSYSSSMN